VFEGRASNRHFFSHGLTIRGGATMKQNEKDQSPARYLSGRSDGDKPLRFSQGFVVSKMNKTIAPQPLKTLVTPAAKQQAESLGIELSSFIMHMAAKADTMPVTIRIPMADFKKINSAVRGGRIHEWCTDVITDAINGAGEDLVGNRIVLDLPAKTAAKLREAAEFEEVSVSEYLLDGLKRDLALSKELMAAEKN
jgi:hypothetical protein